MPVGYSPRSVDSTSAFRATEIPPPDSRRGCLTLLERLAAGERRLSTVIVSAYGDMPNIRTAMNRGAFDFLTKPIDFTEFDTTLRRSIAHVCALRRPGRGKPRPSSRKRRSRVSSRPVWRAR
jgi:FixJ family two-component response regulator